MKMIFAGIEGSVQPEDFLYNCTRTQCQKEYYTPIKDFSDLLLYFNLPAQSSAIAFYLELCTGVEVQIMPCNLVIAQKPDSGWYAVAQFATGDDLETDVTFFYIKAVVISGSNNYIFYSQQYEIDKCSRLTKVEACYNDAPVNTFPDQTDCNGIYYGYDALGSGIGSLSLRYIHFMYVRRSNVIKTKNKLSLTYFNNRLAYKSTLTVNYSFITGELFPEFAADQLTAIFLRGNFKINAVDYTLDASQDFSALDETFMWKIEAVLSAYCKQYFDCVQTVCALPACNDSGEDECCTPIVVSATAKVLDCCTPIIVNAVSETIDVGDLIAFGSLNNE